MLTICNAYSKTVWVAIMWYTPNCIDGGDWTKEGWWGIAPNQCANVFGGDLSDVNRYFCYYAIADDGTLWSGPYHRSIPDHVFDWCEWVADSQSYDVGFRLLDIGDNDDFTLTLWKFDWGGVHIL